MFRLVIFLVLFVGILLGVMGSRLFEGWFGTGSRNGEKPIGSSVVEPPPSSAMADEARLTSDALVWRNQVIRFADLPQKIPAIKQELSQGQLRVTVAKDVDHLDEQTVQESLRNGGVPATFSYER